MLTVISQAVPPSLTLDMLLALRGPDAAAPPPGEQDLSRGGAYAVTEKVTPGAAGVLGVPLLICRPTSATSIPAGIIYYIHGGGMVMGDNRLGLVGMLDLAQELSCAVVSVGYRLAPEHPHPAPLEDCYTGRVWAAEHAGEFGVDPGRVVVAGVSAGAGLAAAAALAARDRGGPALLGQLLCSPMLDDRNDTPSAVQMAGVGNWDRTANEAGWIALLGPGRGGADVSPYAAPARAGNLSGLPPAFIDVGSAETFRDEDVAYASRIWQAGGVAELHVWPGGFHGFDVLAPHARLSRDARAARIQWLRRIFKVEPTKLPLDRTVIRPAGGSLTSSEASVG